MKHRHQQPNGKLPLHLLAVLLLLLFAQFATAHHAAEHLTHEHAELCELYSVAEKHDAAACVDLPHHPVTGTGDNYPSLLPAFYRQLTSRAYAIRAPPIA